MDWMITDRHWEAVMGRIVSVAHDDWPEKPYVLWQQADAPSGPSGVMIAFYLDGSTAQQLVGLGATQAADTMHTTLLFLADSAEKLSRSDRIENLKAAVEGWARVTSPMPAEINGLGVFNPGPGSDTPVTYANVDCPRLPQARHALALAVSGAGLDIDSSHGYTPHVTMGYGDLSGQVERPDLSTTFDSVSIAIGPSRVSFKLGGVGSHT